MSTSQTPATTRNADASQAVSARPAGPPPALLPGGAFDQLVARQAATGQFSGTVLLAYQGAPVLARAYGMADQQGQVPNRIDTAFALASVTKMFTATAIIQLVEQGKVELYQTVGTYLDGFPAQIADTVTVHQLLIHTSGMGDFRTSPAFLKEGGTWTSAAGFINGIMAVVRQSPLLFTPGTRVSYSNSGYATLGAIVGQVTGRSYAHYYDYVRAQVFARAGMTRSDFYTKPQWLADPGIARPYALQSGGKRTDVTSSQDFIGNPAGNAFSTAPDMARFGRALRDGTLLGPAYADLATSAKYPGSPSPTTPAAPGQNEAYVGGTDIDNNQRIVTVGGGNTGETTFIDIYPDLDWDAVVLSNYDHINLSGIVSGERQPITTRQA